MEREKHQYLYLLRLIPRLLDEGNWQESDYDIVQRHFEALQRLRDEGRLILAGRTSGRARIVSAW